MGKVYDIAPNVVENFNFNQHYIGFLQGAEKELIVAEPLKIRSHTVQPGAKITAFLSGSVRTSFPITKGVYMTYMGMYGMDALFEFSNENKHQGNLFQERPRWFIAFGVIPSMDRFMMKSGTHTAWDVVPKVIEYLEE